MGLRDLIASVRENWAGYRALKIVSKAQAEYTRVVIEFPSQLQSLIPQDSVYELQGSTGQGNITAAPWIAAFNPTITRSATQGFYLVYLFSVDMRRLYLSIAFGTTQFESYFPHVRERHAKLVAASAHLNTLITSVRPLVSGGIDLAASPRDRMHADYEKSSIVAIEYDLDSLSQEDELVGDFKYMLDLYHDLVANPLLPNIQQLLESQIQPPAITEEPNVIEFVPREPNTKNGAKAGAGDARRVSKESKKIGDKGEEIAFNFEVARVSKFGGSIKEVKWVAREGSTPGWDICSVEQDGEPRYIEVKSSVTQKVSNLILTRTEFLAAAAQKWKYCIYLITDVMKSRPTIEIIRDPIKRIADGQLTAIEDSWLVGLRPRPER